MSQPRWTGVRGLLFGGALVAVALGLRVLTDAELGDQFPFAAFVLVTAITASVAGWRNAAIAHLAGLIAGDWFFLGPRNELFELNLTTAYGVFFYLSIGLVICLFTARWQASARRAESGIHESEQAQETLLAGQEQLRAHASDLESRVAVRTQELRDALGRLQAFTYSMVHDMRAPLRAIRGFGTILEMEADPAARREYARRVCESADRLDQLITDLQSYSDTAAKPVQIEPVEVERLVDEVLEQYPKLAEARAHIQVHRPMPRVCGNAALLALSLAHLLENALKFIPPGRTPNVEVSCERRERMVRIWVVDNGVGIAPEYHERIFGLFQQLTGPAAGKGTGVGLAIARRAVEKMCGTIGLESTRGEGSRFWVELPAATLLSPPCDCRTSRTTQKDPMQMMQFTPAE